MSQLDKVRAELDSIESADLLGDERLSDPSALRTLHEVFCEDDSETSANRAAVQELMDFVPPYVQDDLEKRGQAFRFNINYGLASAMKNEAVGPFVDIFNSPSSVVKIVLDDDVDADQRGAWGSIMSDEFTKAIRSWDLMPSNILQLVDTLVTQGVSIPWFEDQSTLVHEIGSLEDCKFDADAKAVPSLIDAMTIARTMRVSDLYAKIEGHESKEWHNGWNVAEVKRLIAGAKPKSDRFDNWNYEAAARAVKACRASNPYRLPSIELIWGMIREKDGSISVYAVPKDGMKLGETNDGAEPEKWVYRRRSAYKDANRMLQIFTFSVGNKNRIYTIRGYGYALYEPGQADNIMRSKMMDAAAFRASEVFQPESTVDAIEDLQFRDMGRYMLAPKALRAVQMQNIQQLDKNIGFVLSSNMEVMGKHGAGLSSSSIVNNPNARRNEMQVTAELEYTSKMQGFAVSLFYAPYDKYMRELVRRAFTETQTDLAVADMVEKMKEACIARGVPRDVLNRIDLEATTAVRLSGAGSKGSRLIAFQQLGQLYAEMDPQGKEFFNHDFAAEIKGQEAADRYFGHPGERRGHVDIALARLENHDLLEGTMVEPVPGENSMVHLEEHIEELVAGLEEVNQGAVDLPSWTMRNIPLYRHCVDTLEGTTVHESRMGQLKSFRQQVQQAGEVIDNGLRHINKMREEQGDMSQGLAPDGANPAAAPTPEQMEQSAALQDLQLKRAKMFAEAQAKIQIMQQQSEAKQAIEQQESMARILTMEAETKAEIRRKEILAKAATGS